MSALRPSGCDQSKRVLNPGWHSSFGGTSRQCLATTPSRFSLIIASFQSSSSTAAPLELTALARLCAPGPLQRSWTSLLGNQLWIPYNLPEMMIGVLKIACVTTPKGVLRRLDDNST